VTRLPPLLDFFIIVFESR